MAMELVMRMKTSVGMDINDASDAAADTDGDGLTILMRRKLQQMQIVMMMELVMPLEVSK